MVSSAAAMRRISVRNLAAHKVRLILTMVSVILGTAFVAGSFVFTDTLKGTFNKIVDVSDKGVDVQVTAKDSDAPGVPISFANTLKSTPGVKAVQLDANAPAVLIGSNGKRVNSGGAPSQAEIWNGPGSRITAPPTFLSGEPPASAGQVAINSTGADKGKLKVGDHTKVILPNRGIENVTVSGIFKIDTQTGGFLDVMFTRSQGLALLTDGSHVNSMSVSSTGVSQQVLRNRIAAELPSGMQAKTGDQVRKDDRNSVASSLGFVNSFLLAFGFIALLAGTFIIYNTFAMLIAQRSRELALLRAVGAERRQVTRGVLFEASIIGVVGSLLGVAGGVGLAYGLHALLDATNSGLPSGSLSLQPRTIIVSLLVGTIVTMFSAYAPARRAGKTAPVAAMRQDEPSHGTLRRRTLIGSFVGAAGVVATVGGAMASKAGTAAELLGLGLLGVGAGVLLLAPVLSRYVVGGLGAVLARPFGPSGKLARTNAIRNPRRTAATAFSLTIGLMLVAGIAVIGASMKKSINHIVDNTVRADYIVTAVGNNALPGPATEAVRNAPGVGDFAALHGVTARIAGGKKSYGMAEEGDFAAMAKFTWISGGGQATGTNLIASEDSAKSHHWTVGEHVTLTAPGGPSQTVTVTGIYKNDPLLNPWIVSDQVYRKLTPSNELNSFVALVKAAPGTSQAQLRTNLEKATDPFYIAQVQDRDQYKGQVAGYVNTMLSILYGLLGLAIIIAILGVINTLALSVVERRREIGMVRAVGMQRRQVRRTIRLESVLIALFGAVLGLGLGLTFGTLFARTLHDQGLTYLQVPWAQSAVFLVLSALVGVLAAVWPAARAARTKPLEAIADI